MFEKHVTRPTKHRIEVRLCLTDGRAVEGALFLSQGERLSDLLNDTRAFLPVETSAGTEFVGKAMIGTALARGEAWAEAGAGCPYAVLRVEPHCTDAELRAAWMKRMKASHPDRLASLGLDEAIVTAARKACQRINAAYDEAVRTRRAAA